MEQNRAKETKKNSSEDSIHEVILLVGQGITLQKAVKCTECTYAILFQ